MDAEEAWRQAYPRDVDPVNDLAVNNSVFLGQFDKGMQEVNNAIRISPHVIAGFDAVALGYLAQNRADEAKAVLTTGLRNNPDNQAIHFDLFGVAAALGDQDGMQRELQWAEGKVGGSLLLGFAATGRAGTLGQMKKARDFSAQALQIARDNNYKDMAAGFLAFRSLLEALVGNSSPARQRAAESMTLSRTRTNLPIIAVALALAGDRKQSQGIVEELRRRYPLDTIANNVYIPCALAPSRFRKNLRCRHTPIPMACISGSAMRWCSSERLLSVAVACTFFDRISSPAPRWTTISWESFAARPTERADLQPSYAPGAYVSPASCHSVSSTCRIRCSTSTSMMWLA
jgi:hypothetical protein